MAEGQKRPSECLLNGSTWNQHGSRRVPRQAGMKLSFEFRGAGGWPKGTSARGGMFSRRRVGNAPPHHPPRGGSRGAVSKKLACILFNKAGGSECGAEFRLHQEPTRILKHAFFANSRQTMIFLNATRPCSLTKQCVSPARTNYGCPSHQKAHRHTTTSTVLKT